MKQSTKDKISTSLRGRQVTDSRKLAQNATKHGQYSHRLYSKWLGMMQRCYREANINYKYYGGRGITVCSEWHDIVNFLDDMDRQYARGLTIDRINNDEGYSKGNCRWATPKEQQNNMRSNRRFSFNGEELTVREIEAITGVNHHKIWQRIMRDGWTVEKASTKGGIPFVS